MAGCLLQNSIKRESCEYSVAGVRALYLINYDSVINCKEKGGEDEKSEYIETIELKDDHKAYKIDFVNNTASFSDDLAENGNNGKYRTHTVNFTLENYDYQTINEGKALSLAKFVAVVVDKKGNCIILGKDNGLSATSYNYASGAADADANGWTVVLAGSELGIAPRLLNEEVISSLTESGSQIVP